MLLLRGWCGKKTLLLSLCFTVFFFEGENIVLYTPKEVSRRVYFNLTCVYFFLSQNETLLLFVDKLFFFLQLHTGKCT